MRVATGIFEPGGGATLVVRIPEVLSETERQAKYDEPLGRKLTELRIEHSLRGFSIWGNDKSGITGVGIKVRTEGIVELG